MSIKIVSTSPYDDQKMGTAGLRKKSKVVMQPNYVENFVQSIFNTIGDARGKVYVLGGDGRFYNDIAIQKIIKIAAANGVAKLIIGRNGFVSTPAASHIILMNKLDGGFVLSASHNPGGIDGDFGIKYANQSGGQAPSQVSDKIYQNSKTIREYKIFDSEDIDLSGLGTQKLGDMIIEIIDPVKDYAAMMEQIFDFDALRKLFAGGFTMKFDAMNAVTGPYAVKIFEEMLGAAPGSVINATPLPDFGGLHPDPNLVHAKELISILYGENAPDFGAANDGDGDRNMILGRKFFVSPSDSLAIITDNYALIPAYKDGIYGVARSAATSTAVCRVAQARDLPCYEVPTGWKYFVNLMDSNRITFCGEESFGTGSSHIREKDGIWAVLFWLSIIAATGKSVEEITVEHWRKYGRTYYIRNDYEGVPTDIADKLMADLEAKLPSLVGQSFGEYTVTAAAPFVYNDPVDHSSTANGLIIKFANEARIIYRLSGTGSSGATIRVYNEQYSKDNISGDSLEVLKKLSALAADIAEISLRTGKTQADVTT
jgi:phosphoglucomutase